MSGVELRGKLDELTLDKRVGIKELCKKYGITPECSDPGGELKTMIFQFDDDVTNMELFALDMEAITGVTVHKFKRRVCGHRIPCPL